MTVHIVDYGVCNLGSVRRAFEECGADAVLTTDPSSLRGASHIVVPGVGAFTDGMQALNSQGWVPSIQHAALDQKIPTLGICLGMQLFASLGDEGGGHSGLALIPGTVTKLKPQDKKLRVPHVGWNEIYTKKDNALMTGIQQGSDFYFVHSYHFVPSDPADIFLETPYGENLVSGVQKGNIYGVQFHPEKSGRAGFQLIKNFLGLSC